ncbi:hypothetical protein [Phocaeicola vulgatus]|uniref:hypothetical protein n=1 Tax=Phocaeicola vulgatus TaxID=821 RepID=UPI0018994AD2|nr:hypothetical protein [Phocaeicola vulgatus]MDB1067937.1 hypothetical protein [Phocaeicola vulgatus]MDB1078941.1 hypothetical protein [Phocaeicola vulgatus]
MKMRYSMGLYLCMTVLLPYHEFLSGSHWLYMFGHAGWLHYLLNGMAWAFLWKVITPARTLVAWMFAVGISFFIPSGSPVIGWSVIIYYYMGLCLSSMDGGRRNRLFAITALGFFLPHIAGGYHAAMLAAGWILRKLEVGWQRTLK